MIFLDYFFSLFIHVISGHLREYKEDLRSLDQCLTSLEHDARQSRLAMEADGQADTKTRERTEGAATAVRAMYGDSCSANRVDPDPMCSWQNRMFDSGGSRSSPRLHVLGNVARVVLRGGSLSLWSGW